MTWIMLNPGTNYLSTENTLNNKSENFMSCVKKDMYKGVIGQILPPNEQEYAHGTKRIW